jgi:murein DD-endopeptidase MepM/ murein hydrolase activator NlpD
VAEQRALRPVVGAITQVLTPRHTGIDLAAPLGALIVADDDGVVTAVGWVAVGGRRVCVGHPSGVESCAYHTSAALVRVGDRVARGQPIALVGLTGVTTGPHMHWEATVGTRIVDPLAR